MNRFHKKCFVFSAALHGMLLLIAVVCPAFLSRPSKVEDFPIIDFVPTKQVDSAMMGGGNPHAKPPPMSLPKPPSPVVKETPPEPAKTEKKEVVKEDPKQKDPDPVEKVSHKIDPDSFELKPAKRKIEVSTKPVTRRVEKRDTRAVKDNSEAEERQERQEREIAAAQRRAAIGRVAASLKDSMSSNTTIDDNYGPGGGGDTYGNYAQFVKSLYERAWVAPEDAANDNAVARVMITIASNGEVINSKIIRASGDVAVDKSVQRTLERVTFVAPFPEGAKEKQRTYTINFNLKAKRAMG